MIKNDVIFWNVDTQFDFVEPTGKLYVRNAEKIKPLWRNITELAKKRNIKVINTADYHHVHSEELSDTPDFVNTFPEHCMAGTLGAQYIEETNPENPLIIDWDKKIDLRDDVFDQNRNIIIRKDAFDVFKGNPFTNGIVESLNPGIVVVYGVTTNVCVHFAVMGLANRLKQVFVIKDAIKELPNIPLPFDSWDKDFVTLIAYKKLQEILS